jgi:hypothetical protein
MRGVRFGLALVATAVAVACTSSPSGSTLSPTSPTQSGGNASADGSTLKASVPSPVSPQGGERVDTRRPVLTFTNATGTFADGAFTYRIEVYEGSTLAGTVTVAQASGSTTSYTPEVDLKFDSAYRWQVRAEQDGTFTAYSAAAEFVTPLAPVAFGGGGSGPYGAPRSISLQEAFSLITTVHNAERWNLGRSSTREQRVEFWFRAVGIVHYGHAIYNPQGGDRDWCVKDAGGGRPPSDDALVRCGSRDAWDMIVGAGADGYAFHTDYIGRLGFEQNVYPPPIPGGGGTGAAPLPPDPNRPPLPDVRGQIAALTAARPDLFAQQCNRGIKYVNNPWQDYIVDNLRLTDPRWGYNAKPNRTAADNNGVPVVAAGDELAYYYGSGVAQGSNQVYLVDILEQHCGPTPRLTWRVFTGEEPGIWTGAGRF